MAYKGTWVPGDSVAICDRCGFKYQNSKLKLEWTGLLVCEKCWDYRHPQELIRSIPDTQNPPAYPRPEGADTYMNEGRLGQGNPLLQDPPSDLYTGYILQENGAPIFTDDGTF